MIETLNGASADVDAARFQWHIGTTVCLDLFDVANAIRGPCCVPGNHASFDIK